MAVHRSGRVLPGSGKLTARDRVALRLAVRDGVSLLPLARVYGVTHQAVWWHVRDVISRRRTTRRRG